MKNSKNYKGHFTYYSNLPTADYKTTDAIDFETDNLHWLDLLRSVKIKTSFFTEANDFTFESTGEVIWNKDAQQ